MKKMLFVAMMLAALATTKTNAQLRDNLSFGPLVGFGHSWINYDLGGNISRKFNPSFNAGARLLYSATPHLGFGLDGTFRTEGIKLGYITGNKETTHLNYINLDPKLYYFFGKYGQAFRPQIGIGPNFGFLVGGKTKLTNGSNAAVETKAKDYFSGFNFGLSGALGFNYRIKSGTWLNVDAVYNNGLDDLSKNYRMLFNNTTFPKSRSIFLTVGVTFGIGHVESKK